MKPKRLDAVCSARVDSHKEKIDEKSIWETRHKSDKHELDIVNYLCDSKSGEKDVTLFEFLNGNIFSGENDFLLVSLAFRQKEGYRVPWLYK